MRSPLVLALALLGTPGCSFTDLSGLEGKPAPEQTKGGGGEGGEGGEGGAGEGGAGSGGSLNACLPNSADCDGDGACDDLTANVDHCGGCGVTCPGSSPGCEQGACVLSDTVVGPIGMVLDLDEGQLIVHGAGAQRVDLATAETTPITALGICTLIWGIFLGQDDYYAACDSGGVYRVSRSQFEFEQLATGISQAVAGADLYVYWSVAAPSATEAQEQGLRETGQIARQIKGNTSEAIVHDVVAPSRIATSSTHVYFTDSIGGTVRRTNFNGYGPEVLSASEPGAFDLLVDDDRIYWTTLDGHIRTMTTADIGVNAPELVISEEPVVSGSSVSPAAIYGIAVDESWVYYTVGSQPLDAPTGALRRFPVTCTAACDDQVETLFSSEDSWLARIVHDSDSVYFATHQTGIVYRRDKDATVLVAP